MFFYFKTANVPEAMPHSLNRTPTSWTVASVSRDGAPGSIYAPVSYNTAGTTDKTDNLYNLGRNYIVLASSTANTWAEVLIS